MIITDYPNYHIFKNGAVLSEGNKFNKPRFLKPYLQKSTGYYSVNLYKDGKLLPQRIHRLLALHFIPKIEGKNTVDHIDRNRTNNNINNLRWVTDSENSQNTNIRSDNKTGYKNIHFDKSRNKYKVDIQRNGKKHMKRFKTLEEAIEYRDIFY